MMAKEEHFLGIDSDNAALRKDNRLLRDDNACLRQSLAEWKSRCEELEAMCMERRVCEEFSGIYAHQSLHMQLSGTQIPRHHFRLEKGIRVV